MTTNGIVIGAGYTGARLAAQLGAYGPVIAVTGSDASATRLAMTGLDARAWNLDSEQPAPFAAAEIGGVTLWYLAPPPDAGDDDPRLRNCLDRLPAVPRRIVYASTTGVYGDAAGGTVTEDTPIAPGNERSQRRTAAEALVQQYAARSGAEWVVLRVPGIYGPGRLPLERIRRGGPVIAEAEAGPGNRIHVDDLVRCCLAAGTTLRVANRVFNVGDGEHASTSEYFRKVAQAAGLPPPPQLTRAEAQQRLSEGMWSFLADSRRVDTTRMRSELGVLPRWQDLDEGIRASLGAD